MSERDDLVRAIAALEAQREALGDSVVDSGVRSLRAALAELEAAPGKASEERKLATVLLADVTGFTAMSEARDAEEVGDTLNALWQRLDGVILDHGGMIDKHIGDAVMALWGAGQSREDDPERAIRSALAMQEEVGEFAQSRGELLAMRIGINSGPVLFGDLDTTGEFLAIGDTVNVARRLEEAAPSGGVLISHDTLVHVRGIFDIQPQPPLVVKGRRRPLRTYVVDRAKPRAFRMDTRGVEGVETRMIGRDAELLTLEGHLREVMDRRATQMVTIIGDAGVGKSRLLYEFEKWIDLLPDQVWYFKGRARPSAQTLPYGVVRDMFAFRFELLETDSAPVLMDKWRAGMGAALNSDQADIVGHFVGFDFSSSPAVANLLGSESYVQLARSYLKDYFQAMTTQPTVVFVEDAHWADDSSLELFLYLAGELDDAKLLLVCLARPPLIERRPEWETVLRQGSEPESQPRTKAPHTILQLNPLTAPDSGALVDEILRRAPAIPEQLRAVVVDGAAGNPYYIEELIKRLIEDGVIVRGDDHWRIEADRLTGFKVPSTLTGVLQARLDRLSREQKLLLQRASVVGRRFWDAAVVALSGEDLGADEVDELLRHLCRRELVLPREPSAFAGTKEYVFKHALLHDVTYESVLLKDRRVYHDRVAQWLEDNATDRPGEYCVSIAGHLELAGRTDRSAEYLRRAAVDLHLMGAYRDAMATYEHALSQLPDDDLSARSAVLVGIGNAARQLGDYGLAASKLDEGRILAAEIGDAATEITALNWLGLALRVQGDNEGAHDYLTQALELARSCDDCPGIALSLYNLGDLAFRRGEAEDAERFAAESLAIYRDIGDRRGMAFALRVLGFAANLRGAYRQARAFHRDSLTIYRDIGDSWGMAACYINLGEAYRKEDEFRSAAEHLESALEIACETGARYEQTVCHNNLGHVYIGMGDTDRAREYLTRALDDSLDMGVHPVALESLVGMAELELAAGDYARAATLIGQVMTHPALHDETAQYAGPVLDSLRRVLPAAELEEYLARGAEADLAALRAGGKPTARARVGRSPSG